jgi:hypothetical protein
LGRIFSNLGQLETNATLVRWADEWRALGASWCAFVSCNGQIRASAGETELIEGDAADLKM